jgi:trans-aconitate 2-methyltransferase
MHNPWNAALYDDKHSFVWQHGAALVELLVPRPGERILDLGCGTGHLTAQLAAAGAEVVGIDSSAEMIRQARSSYPALRFELTDARNFACDEAFDAVFSNAALHWIREPEQVIRSVYHALKPDGRFVAELGGKGNVQTIATALDRAARRLGHGPCESAWYFPGIAEYATLLERGGLEVTLALLFERPTQLEGEQGLREWVRMFAGWFLERIASTQRAEFLRLVEEEVRPLLYREGHWYADYRRLRVVARRMQR